MFWERYVPCMGNAYSIPCNSDEMPIGWNVLFGHVTYAEFEANFFFLPAGSNIMQSWNLFARHLSLSVEATEMQGCALQGTSCPRHAMRIIVAWYVWWGRGGVNFE